MIECFAFSILIKMLYVILEVELMCLLTPLDQRPCDTGIFRGQVWNSASSELFMLGKSSLLAELRFAPDCRQESLCPPRAGVHGAPIVVPLKQEVVCM